MYKITGKMLRPYQLDIIKSLQTHQHIFLCLGRRSGKSLIAIYLANLQICKHWHEIFHVIIFSKEKAQARATYAKNVLDDGTSLFKILHPSAKYNHYMSEITYANGSTISFSGASVLEAERGKRCRLLILDEFASYGIGIEHFYPFLQQPERDTIVVTSTPRGFNEFYDLKIHAENNPKWFVMHKGSIELGLITEEQYNDMAGDRNFLAQEFKADFNSPNAGAIYSEPIIVDKHNIVQSIPIYCGVDLGKMSDATAFVFAQVVNNKIHIILCKEYLGMVVSDIVADIRYQLQLMNINISQVQFYLPHDSQIRSETTGLSRIDQLRQFGFKCQMSPFKSIMEGIDLTRSIWGDIIWSRETCIDAINNIKQYVRGVDDKPNTAKSVHKYTNTPDALRYLTMALEQGRLVKSWRERVDTQILKYNKFERL